VNDFLHFLRVLLFYYFILSGTFFLISTAIGMIRFPDFFTRLHAGSKCLVAGGGSIFIGFIIYEGLSPVSLKLLLLIAVLFAINPTAVHALARSAFHSGHLPVSPGQLSSKKETGKEQSDE